MNNIIVDDRFHAGYNRRVAKCIRLWCALDLQTVLDMSFQPSLTAKTSSGAVPVDAAIRYRIEPRLLQRRTCLRTSRKTRESQTYLRIPQGRRHRSHCGDDVVLSLPWLPIASAVSVTVKKPIPRILRKNRRK